MDDSETDHYIEPPEGLDGFVDQRLHFTFLPNISLKRDRFDVRRLRRDEPGGRLYRCHVDVCQDDIGAFCRKQERGFEADAAEKQEIDLESLQRSTRPRPRDGTGRTTRHQL